MNPVAVPSEWAIPVLSRLLAALPNTLSLARLALGPAFPWVPAGWRLAVVAFATGSDFADGALSRRLRLASSTGRLLDPLADKVFVLGVVSTLVWGETLPLWQAALLAVREVGVLIRGACLLWRGGWGAGGPPAPSLFGKAATAAQFVFLLTVLLLGRSEPLAFAPAAGLTVLAAVDMLVRAWKDRPGEGGA
jgi:phosphatidylglycerophosphate synthase